MSDYTPTTGVIRRRAAEPRYEGYDRRKRVVRELERDFDRWLAEHDAALIEKLADEWTLDYAHYRKTTGLGPVPYLMEKARQRREEQDHV